MKYVLGLDMGGTNSVLGIVSREGKVLGRKSFPTQQYKEISSYIQALYEAALEITQPYGGLTEVEGIGIGAPNANYYTGEIQGAMNLPWANVPLSKLVSERLGIPCHITNDANAAALGEMTYGGAKGMKHFIMITLGTGVGSGIVVDGKVLYGADGFAGELGHTCVDRSADARMCNCGKRGCLEAYCSATGLARTAKELGTPWTNSYEVFLAAEQGDKKAAEIFRYTGEILGRSLADFVAFSAPQAIFLFGGLCKSGHWIMDPVVEALNEYVLPIWRGKVPVCFSQLNEADAAVLGASALAW